MAAVLKPMGGPGEGLMSLPLKGYALAVANAGFGELSPPSGTRRLRVQLVK